MTTAVRPQQGRTAVPVSRCHRVTASPPLFLLSLASLPQLAIKVHQTAAARSDPLQLLDDMARVLFLFHLLGDETRSICWRYTARTAEYGP